ncbi:L-rhamnose mutarotase [Demequina sp.]|uniref:L-rhamnose mutarotase n=1 Tax=Demequina sp. TaxID=2050685 RepID=UPI0025CE3802|nr:L-rhamnose mutarotase [Demequina sp.]
MTQRVCFTLTLHPDMVDEYVARHRAVWPEMLAAIAESGRRNYSIFVRPDGLVVGYYETDDDTESARRLAADPRTARWEAESARFFAGLGGTRPDQAITPLAEAFNLDAQRHALDL